MPLENRTQPIKAQAPSGVNEYTTRKQQTRQHGGISKAAPAKTAQKVLQTGKPMSYVSTNDIEQNAAPQPTTPAPVAKPRYSLDDLKLPEPSFTGPLIYSADGLAANIYKQPFSTPWQSQAPLSQTQQRSSSQTPVQQENVYSAHQQQQPATKAPPVIQENAQLGTHTDPDIKQFSKALLEASRIPTQEDLDQFDFQMKREWDAIQAEKKRERNAQVSRSCICTLF